MAEDSLHVGTFASHRIDGREVPANVVGKHIWYSHSKGYFLVVDDNNSPVQTFGFYHFRKYVEAGIVSYMNPGVEQHMLEELDRAIDEGRDGKDQEIPGIDGKIKKPAGERKETLLKTNRQQAAQEHPDDGLEQPPEQDAGRGGYAEYNRAVRDEQARRAKPPKDPTRHIIWFFFITLFIALVIAGVMVFFPGVMRSITSFLPM